MSESDFSETTTEKYVCPNCGHLRDPKLYEFADRLDLIDEYLLENPSLIKQYFSAARNGIIYACVIYVWILTFSIPSDFYYIGIPLTLLAVVLLFYFGTRKNELPKKIAEHASFGNLNYSHHTMIVLFFTLFLSITYNNF